MSKFKVGDRVRVVEAMGEDRAYGLGSGVIGKIKEVKGEAYYLTGEGINEHRAMDEIQLEFVGPHTIDDVQEGDLLKYKENDYYKRVLGRCGKVVFLSVNWDKGEEEETRASVYILSISDIKEQLDLVSESPSDITEVSMNEVAKAMNIPVSQLRIKKNE